MRNPNEEYANLQSGIASRLELLKTNLQAQAEINADYITWADVGDLTEVVRRLDSLNEFIGVAEIEE